MSFQGLAPSFWGPIADSIGRRPVLISTLLVYLIANIGLALTRNFAGLMVLRALQAIGSSSTIAIGAGVIGDIATGEERGGVMGVFGGIRMFGQAIGPVLGGVLTQFLGFRSIFYFLLILAAIVLILIIGFLPETLRQIAGDGSVPLRGIYRPLMTRSSSSTRNCQRRRQSPRLSILTSLKETMKILAEKDALVSLLYGGIIYTIWSMITSSTPTLWREEYTLTDVQIGLCFIPNGVGCVLGSFATGRMMDRHYRIEAEAYRREHALGCATELRVYVYPTFPIERARLRSVYHINTVFAIATAIYGFTVEWHIAVPLTVQFITALTATAVFNINSTLMIDLLLETPASATAMNNLVRCTLGGIGVTLIERSIGTIKEGPTFLALGVISLCCMALVSIERVRGPGWRQARLRRALAG